MDLSSTRFYFYADAGNDRGDLTFFDFYIISKMIHLQKGKL